MAALVGDVNRRKRDDVGTTAAPPSTRSRPSVLRAEDDGMRKAAREGFAACDVPIVRRIVMRKKRRFSRKRRAV